MARANVIHSEDAVMIEFKGNKSKPEPSTAVIKFPGGHVEVSRTSDGKYWAHLEVVSSDNVVDSRIDYEYEAWKAIGIPELPMGDQVKKIAILIGNSVPHFDQDVC
jgi:hypothetical protein